MFVKPGSDFRATGQQVSEIMAVRLRRPGRRQGVREEFAGIDRVGHQSLAFGVRWVSSLLPTLKGHGKAVTIVA